jgi:hypothetical protein
MYEAAVDASATNIEANPWYRITMKAQTYGVVEIVPLATFQFDGYFSTQLTVVVADVDDNETVCGTLADPLAVLPVVACPSTGVYKVTIRSLQASTQLTLSSVGIMHNCDCALTSLDSTLMPG